MATILVCGECNLIVLTFLLNAHTEWFMICFGSFVNINVVYGIITAFLFEYNRY